MTKNRSINVDKYWYPWYNNNVGTVLYNRGCIAHKSENVISDKVDDLNFVIRCIKSTCNMWRNGSTFSEVSPDIVCVISEPSITHWSVPLNETARCFDITNEVLRVLHVQYSHLRHILLL